MFIKVGVQGGPVSALDLSAKMALSIDDMNSDFR